MKGWFRHNGLSIAALSIFLLLLVGQCLTGWRNHNGDRLEHGAPALSLADYLGRGNFGEATSENWESEFLQMAAYVLLTVFLRQRGSAESKSFTDDEAVDRDPRHDRDKADAPYPVQRGGWLLTLYEWSLSLAFLVLFLLAFAWHVAGGLRLDERRAGAGPTCSYIPVRLPVVGGILVPVLAELAKRVSCSRCYRAFVHLATPARFAGIEASIGAS